MHVGDAAVRHRHRRSTRSAHDDHAALADEHAIATR
jgi:RNase P protein component